jgi:hypothetical protein
MTRRPGWWLDAALTVSLVLLIGIVFVMLVVDAPDGKQPKQVSGLDSLAQLEMQLVAEDDPTSWMVPYLAGSGGSIGGCPCR